MPSTNGQPVTLQPQLQLHLLGSPLVTWKNTSLDIPRRLVRALLYRLACAPRPVTRGNLQLLFWSDTPESVARRNLSHHLTHLRRAFPLPQVLLTTADEIWLDLSQIWCDVLEFGGVSLDSEVDTSLLHQTISLYRGPFLDGFNLPGCPEFEHWCLVERNALELQYLKVLEYLVEHNTEAGEIRQAIKYAQQYLETDPLSETMHRRLIKLYAGTGDRQLALRQFERCSSILKSDLGVSPLPETQAVYQAVLLGLPRFSEPAPYQQPPQLPSAEVPLFGRDNELCKLEEIYRNLQGQKGQVILISGEAGIGKSSLLQTFTERHKQEACLLFGYGHKGERTIPYQPIMHILHTILGLEENGEGVKKTHLLVEGEPPDFIEPAWLSEISRLLPDIQSIYPELPSPLPLEPESGRSRLFDALCHTILAISLARGPLLLCLEDLQWVDLTTRAWLVHIGRYLSHEIYPILILGTYRSEEAETLLDLRQNLARAGALIELKLSGLEESATLDLVRHLVGGRPGDKALASQLHQTTGGNPFFLIEIVHKLIEDGKLDEHLQEPLGFTLPESVQAAVQARLQLLSPISRQVLDAGAVLGASFNIELLRLVAGRSHAEIFTALEELVLRLLLVEGSQEYRFIHEIIRQHVEESLGPVRRQLLHRRAARAYERIKKDAFSPLAYHFDLAGDPKKALHYHECAAKQAQDLFAWRMVEFHQEHMLKSLKSIDPDNTQPDYIQQRGKVLAMRASAYYLQGRYEARDTDLDALSNLGEASNDDHVRLQALSNRVAYLNMDGAYNQATLVAKKGLILLRSSPSLSRDADMARAARSHLLAQIGYAKYFLGAPLQALGVLEEACGHCEGEIDPDLCRSILMEDKYKLPLSPGEGKVDFKICGRILHVLSHVSRHLGDNARALEYQQLASTCHRETGDYNHLACGLIDIGVLHKNLGDISEAMSFLEEGLELANRVGSKQAQAYGLVHSGNLYLYQGDYSGAELQYQQALEVEPAIQSESINAAAEAGLGLSMYHLGEYAQSRHWLERSLQRARAANLRKWVAKTLIQLGFLDIGEGDLPLAQQHLDEALAVAQECLSGDCLAAGLVLKARLERLAGNPNSALETAAEVVCMAQQINLACCEMWGEIETGLVYLALGDLSSAQVHTQRAVELAPRAGQDWIGCEEAYYAHAYVLRVLNRNKAADLQERYAWETIQDKADLISDPHQRSRYLSKSIPHQLLTTS